MIISRIHIVFLVLVLSAAAVNADVSAQTPLDRYLQDGLENNLVLRGHETDLEVSLQRLREARGFFFPSVDLDARYSRAEGGRTIDIPVGDVLNPVYSSLNDLLGQGAFPAIENQEIAFLREREQESRLRFTQPLFQPRIIHNYRLNKHLVGAQEATVDAYRLQLVREIKVAYYQYVQSARAVKIYESTLDLVSENERVNTSLLAASLVTHDAVLRAQTEVLAVDQQLTEAIRSNDLARSYFNFLLNRPLASEIEIADTSIETPAEVSLLRTSLATADDSADMLQTLQLRALQTRPELARIDRATSASLAATRIERSSLLPGVSLVLDAGTQGTSYGFSPEQNFFMGSVVLRWNLFNGFQNQARIQQSRLQTRRLEYQRQLTEDQIRIEVEDAYKSALDTYEKSLQTARLRVSTAARTYRLVSRKYEEGLAPQVELIDARNALTTAELNESITKTDLLIELAELEFAIGFDASVNN